MDLAIAGLVVHPSADGSQSTRRRAHRRGPAHRRLGGAPSLRNVLQVRGPVGERETSTPAALNDVYGAPGMSACTVLRRRR
jgi:hypothetical protein